MPQDDSEYPSPNIRTSAPDETGTLNPEAIVSSGGEIGSSGEVIKSIDEIGSSGGEAGFSDEEIGSTGEETRTSFDKDIGSSSSQGCNNETQLTNYPDTLV